MPLRLRGLRRLAGFTGQPDIQLAQLWQYFSWLTARNQSVPHPSQTFNSTQKSFIVFLQALLSRRASVFFNGRMGHAQV